MKKLFLFISLLWIFTADAYDFASIAKLINKEFKEQQIRSEFGDELYKEIFQITSDFSQNLTFDELEKYADTVYLDLMANKIIETNTNTFIALVWPVTVGHDKLIHQIFSKYCNVLYRKQILLDEQGAKNFLAQIPSKASHPTGVDLWFQLPYRNYNPMRVYLLECKKSNANFEEIRSYLTKIFSNNARFIQEFEKTYGKKALENLYVTTKCKREIRTAVNIEYAMHINDTHDETKDIGKIVFNDNSINCLKFSDPAKVKVLQNYNSGISALRSLLEKKINNIVIYNSACLSVYGLRDCSDIDFLHDPRVSILRNLHPLLSNQNMYYSRGYIILEDMAGKHYILEDCPHAFENIDLDKADFFKVKVTIDDLLYNPRYYFHFHGIKYTTLEFMHYFKKKRGRPKDLNDVSLMEEHFLNRDKTRGQKKGSEDESVFVEPYSDLIIY